MSLALAALVAAAGLYVLAFGFVPPDDQIAQTIGNGDEGAELDPTTGVPGDDVRTLVQGEEGEVRPPTPDRTPLGPLVNGRRQPATVDPPQFASGDYVVAAGTAEPPDHGGGEVIRYTVEVERGLPFEPDEFAGAVHTILNDPRGWGAGGELQFQRVDEGNVSIRVSLSSADLTDEQCAPLRTLGRVSCWNGGRAVINAERWGLGSDTYGEDLLSYREYLISHEVGHGLGHGHEACPGDGELAPVMVQQTKSLDGCEANPWPNP